MFYGTSGRRPLRFRSTLVTKLYCLRQLYFLAEVILPMAVIFPCGSYILLRKVILLSQLYLPVGKSFFSRRGRRPGVPHQKTFRYSHRFLKTNAGCPVFSQKHETARLYIISFRIFCRPRRRVREEYIRSRSSICQAWKRISLRRDVPNVLSLFLRARRLSQGT